jgi:asparagine synthase (glutamine-hydrolysing)
MATQLAGRSGLKAFTVSWKPLLEDCEPEAAERTAQHLGIAHEILQEEQIVPFEGLQEADGRTPEPTLEPFVPRQRRQWRRLAGHSNVVLNGHGGDDIAIGQSWPYLVYLSKRHDWRALAGDFGGYVFRHGRFPPPGGFRTRIRRILRSEDPSGRYPEWFNAEFAARTNLRECWTRFRDNTSQPGHPLHPNAYQSYHERFWAEILEAEDAGRTGVTLETRMPLLDLRVILYLLKLPPVPWCVNKEIVRVATRNLLPAEIVRRPKTPMVEGELILAEVARVLSVSV